MRNYRPREIAAGIPEKEAYEESRKRYERRVEAIALKSSAEGFDTELLLAQPSYAGDLPHAAQAEGWVPYPHYPSRGWLQSFAGAELLKAEDGTVIAYRLNHSAELEE